MLQKTDRLLLYKLVDHVAENSANCVEALVRLAYVREANVVKQNLLNNKDGDRLAEFRAGLHDAKAKWDDLGREKEVDDFGGVVLDKSADHAKRGQAEVLEWTRFRRRIEERVEEEWNMRFVRVRRALCAEK